MSELPALPSQPVFPLSSIHDPPQERQSVTPNRGHSVGDKCSHPPVLSSFERFAYFDMRRNPVNNKSNEGSREEDTMAQDTLTEAERIAAMEQALKDNQEQNLMWVSNMAVHLVKLDQNIVLLTDILQEMRAERRNGTG